jgi:uncharacterized protein involved in response to NO
MALPPVPATAEPLWTSGFRPFLLLGFAWGALLLPAWMAEYAGAWSATPALAGPLWHGHEMLFGFAVAIIAAVLLTAIPSWALTDEVTGGRLVLLAALWLAGRLAMLAAGALPPWATGIADSVFLPALALVLAPTVLRARRKAFAAPLVILLVLAAANVAFHVSAAGGETRVASRALEAGLLLIMLLYALAGGMLIPVFTSARVPMRTFVIPLDALAVASVAAFAVAEFLEASLATRGILAVVAAAANALRVLRWRGWRVLDDPLLWTLHLGYAWLVAALALRAAAALGGPVPELAWMHAFTVGALGITILGLATRIVLRHTGRPLVVPAAMVGAYLMMLGAAVARVATAFEPGVWLLTASGFLWSAALAVYLACFARFLGTSSLPRAMAG